MSRFKIGFPALRGVNIERNLNSKLAPLKLREPISRIHRFKIGFPKERGANIKKNPDLEFVPLTLGEPKQA
jgi:hypothetical protein